MANASDHTKCISLSNQPCMTLRTLIDLNPDEYNQGLLYYTLMVNLDKCKESCNTLDDLSNSLCVPKKKEDAKTLKFGVFDMIKE